MIPGPPSPSRRCWAAGRGPGPRDRCWYGEQPSRLQQRHHPGSLCCRAAGRNQSLGLTWVLLHHNIPQGRPQIFFGGLVAYSFLALSDPPTRCNQAPTPRAGGGGREGAESGNQGFRLEPSLDGRCTNYGRCTLLRTSLQSERASETSRPDSLPSSEQQPGFPGCSRSRRCGCHRAQVWKPLRPRAHVLTAFSL